METIRWGLVTAIAPVAWGSTYYVTHHFLPADHPLWGAVLRVLPAGVLLLLLCRKRPRGPWWWRSLVLGALTGVVGVVLMLASGVDAADPLGVVVSVAAMALSAFGHVLTKRWGAGVDVLLVTSWQLVAGGAVLVVSAFVVEGAPPPLTGATLLGFAFVSVVATAVAFVAWFTGLRHLDAGTVGLIGLLNPVTGVVLGLLPAAESLGGHQVLGLLLVLSGVLLGQRAGAPQGSAAPGPSRVGSDDVEEVEFHRSGRATSDHR
ncbi:EamA family transporter [Actinosynnema sp. NPDC023794]